MNERGPVGGAGELTALELAQRVINNFRQYAANGVLLHPIHYLPMAEALEFALAAKAPWQPEPGAEQLSLAYWREKSQAAEQQNIELEFRLSRAREVAKAPVLQEHQDKAIRILRPYSILRPYISGAEFGEVVALVAQAIADAREAAAPKPAPLTPDADAIEASSTQDAKLWQPSFPHTQATAGAPLGGNIGEMLEEVNSRSQQKRVAAMKGEPMPTAAKCRCERIAVSAGDSAWGDMDTTKCPIHGAPTPAPGAERSADGYGEVLSIIDRWQRFHLKPDQFVAALREALAAAPPAPTWVCGNGDHACNLRGYCVNQNCDRHASAERVRELEQALRLCIETFEIQGMHDFTAYAIALKALPSRESSNG